MIMNGKSMEIPFLNQYETTVLNTAQLVPSGYTLNDSKLANWKPSIHGDFTVRVVYPLVT